MAGDLTEMENAEKCLQGIIGDKWKENKANSRSNTADTKQLR